MFYTLGLWVLIKSHFCNICRNFGSGLSHPWFLSTCLVFFIIVSFEIVCENVTELISVLNKHIIRILGALVSHLPALNVGFTFDHEISHFHL